MFCPLRTTQPTVLCLCPVARFHLGSQSSVDGGTATATTGSERRSAGELLRRRPRSQPVDDFLAGYLVRPVFGEATDDQVQEVTLP